ncbi:hypothetical protein [Emcibacter sp.]|uniref:hypothetical protein n=1 Tax=Emcibacter sp. TaxID=1979954 RepID=UPI002AA6D0E3|nr:hypothetical protein [Emcibacter sp.]
MKKVISLVLLVLVAFSATGMEHGFAGGCDHSAMAQGSPAHQDAACHDGMTEDDMPLHQTSSCRCDALLSCTAIILPEISGGAPFRYRATLTFYSRGQIPEEYFTGLLAPPPKTVT